MGVATLVSGLQNWLYLKKETDFWCADKNSEKPKVTLIIFGWWWWSEMSVAFLVLGL